MTKEDLKPIDVRQYKVTETGQVLKMTKAQKIQQIEEAKFQSWAEMRNRVIALEKENAELKTKYSHDCSNCAAFGKHCPHKVNGDPYVYDCYLTVVELEKENAELKEYNKYLKRERQGGIQKQYNKVAIIKQQDEKLTRAKEILRGLYFIIQSRIEYKNNTGIADEMWRAEQFLKED